MTSDDVPDVRAGRRRVSLALAISASDAFLGLWIVIPAPLAALFPLAVGAAEVCVWLALAAIAALALAARPCASRRRRGAALILSAVSLVLSLSPLVRLPAASRAADAAFASGFGADAAGPRARPFAIADALTGVALPRDNSICEVYASPGGVPLLVDVWTPSTPGPHAVIVHFHAGGWRSGDHRMHAPLDRWLTARGYVVMAFAYRFAPAHRYPAQLDDARAALAWAKDHAVEHGGDRARIACLGHSAGAQLAMLAAYTAASGVRAVATYYGPIDLDDGWRVPPTPDPLDVRAMIEGYLGGTPDALPGLYHEASPIAHVAAGLPPTLLIQGVRDHVVLIGRTRAMASALHAHGVPVALIEIPWAEHAFDVVFNGPSNQLALYHLERFLTWALAPRG